MSSKTSVTQTKNLSTGTIAKHIVVLRDQKVLLDTDLAALYGVTTSSLGQAVKRNLDRFPEDFMFQLDAAEWESLRSQIVISNTGRGGRRYAPYAFTEQGVAMLSSVLNSPQAIAVNIEIMRAFVRLREVIVSNKELAQRLDELENKADLMELKHDTFEHNTRVQLKQVFEAIRELMTPPESAPLKKRSIGFVEQDETRGKPKAAKAKK
ncbi:ORF6N domain-containing protein [Undibacterium sp. Xuan67W]|uniref:ORF6N domain-containing protein n=1 Tax=Undibacterium sp. Xuan67W TaxID=3413057 RepID=UPI003BF11B55